MIFKTFNNDINGIINRLGVLGHTFGEVKNEFRLGGLSGVKDLYFGSITNSDIEKIREYNSLVTAYQKGLPNGVSAQTAWNRTMLDASNSAKRLVETNNGAAVSEENLAKATQAATLSAKAGKVAIQGLAMAGNILAFMAISKAIQLAIKAFDDYIHRVERASEATKEAIQNYESISSEVEDLESKLEQLNNQINELDPITNADDIVNLQEETKELETQLAILKEKQRIADSDADKVAQKSLGMREASKYETVDVKVNYGYDTVKGQAYVTKDEELLNAIEAYKEYKQRVDDANEALANMASTGEYTKKEWDAQNKVVTEYSQKMEDARTHANELAQKINEEKEGLNGLTDTSQALIDKTESAIETYNDFLNSINGVTDALNEQADAASNIEEPAPKWDYSTTLENLNKVKESLDVLDKSFAKLFDMDDFIGFEDLSSISEAFKDVKGIEDYIKRIQEAGQNTEEISKIFGELTGAYLEHAGVLANVTEENKELVIQMLEEMGIANAEEIVLAQLSAEHEVLALQKQFLAQAGHELIEATIEEINQFLAESDASDIAKQSLAQLALEKIDLSNIQIDESGNIAQLISLANAAGASAVAIAKAQDAINTINTMNKNGANGSAGDFHRLDNATITVGQIKNNTYDWQYEKLNPNDFIITNSPKYTPKYKGGSSTNKAIDQAKKDADSAAKKAAKEAENQFEKTMDFFERRVQVLTDAFQNLEKGMENVFGADAKNTLLSAQIGILDEEINNYTDALAMYRQKANEALSGVDSDLRDKIVDGAVQITDFVGDGTEDVVEAMEAYEGWADEIADCTQKLEELKTQIRKLELQKFNNIVKDFTDQFDLHGDAIDLIDKQIGMLEEAGELIGESFYTRQIEQSEKQLNTLEAEKKRLVEQLNEALTSGRVEKGTDEWLEMVNALSDVEGSILDCKTAIEEFDNELLNLNWQIFERVQTEFGNISSELENLAGLFDDFNDIRVSDGKGTWTKQAIATLGLYAQQYELARHQVGEYSEAIDKLNADYAAGKYSATEYADKLADLVKGQWDAVNSAESLEDAIVSLNETRVNEEIKAVEDEIDAYKKLTDAMVEALTEEKNLHDYEQSIAEKTKAVADIERQLAAMQYDDSAATVAKRKQLEEQLAEAKKALAEEEYDHSIETQKDALNQQYTAFEEERNQEIEALQLTLEDKEKLIADSLEIVKANTATVGEEIAMIAQEHGVVVSDSIISAWQSGENAIASYGEVLTAQSSAFIGNIIGVQEYVYGLQAQANSTADSLSWMFSTRADNLVNELTSSYYSEANLNAMTNTLQNSLVNTLERGYNINSITNALSSIASGADSVASAANRAAQALANMGAVGSGAITNTGFESSSHGFKIYDSVTGKLKDTIYSDNHNYAELMKKYDSSARGIRVQKFAKGGIVSKDKESPLDDIAKAVGEEKLIAVQNDEGVLTKEQTEDLEEFTKALKARHLVPIECAEGILSVEQIEQNRKLSNALTEIDANILKPNSSPNPNLYNFRPGTQSALIPEYVVNDRQNNIHVHYDKMFEFNGDFNNSEQLLDKMKTVAKGTATELLDGINRDFRIHGR